MITNFGTIVLLVISTLYRYVTHFVFLVATLYHMVLRFKLVEFKLIKKGGGGGLKNLELVTNGKSVDG